MSSLVWLDGALLPRGEARIPIDDRGFLYGAACFETMRAHDGVVFRLDRHLDRLERGLRALGVAPPGRAALRSAIAATLEANRLADARVRLTVSAGTGATVGTGPGLEPAGAPAVLVTAAAPGPAPAAARALVAREVRLGPHRPLPFAKTANYLSSLLALQEARSAGFDQALLLDANDDVVEAATANLFALLDGVLVTPPLGSGPLEAGPLPGVTREVVRECARGLRLESEQRRLPLAELKGASEVLLTNSVVGVQPLAEVRVDARSWRFEAPGPVTRALSAAYEEAVGRESGGAGPRPSPTNP